VPDPWLPLELEGHGGRSLPCLLPPTVWLAPLVQQAGVVAALEAAAPRAFVVAGRDDRAWDAGAAEALRAAGVRVELVGADHSLEVADPAESARRPAGVLDELRAFLAPVAATAAGSR
jgi:hypothetical protein